MSQGNKFRSTTNLWKKSQCMIAFPSKYVSFEKAQRFNNFYNWLSYDKIKRSESTQKKQTAEQVLRQFRKVVDEQNRITSKKHKALQIENKMINYQNLPRKVRDSIRSSLIQQQQLRQMRARQKLRSTRRTGSLPNLNYMGKKGVHDIQLSSKVSKNFNPQSYSSFSDSQKKDQKSIKFQNISTRIRDIADSQFKRSNTEDLQAFLNSSGSTNHCTLKLSNKIANRQSLQFKSGSIDKIQTPQLFRKKSQLKKNEIIQQNQQKNNIIKSMTMYNSAGHSQLKNKTKKVQFHFNVKSRNKYFQGIQEGQSEKISQGGSSKQFK